MDRDYDLGSRKFLVPTNRNQSDTEAQWVTQEDEDCIKCIPHCIRVSWAKKIATDGGGLMAGTHGIYDLVIVAHLTLNRLLAMSQELKPKVNKKQTQLNDLEPRDVRETQERGLLNLVS